MAIFDNKNILITGGTGSFGVEFVKKTLANFTPKKLIVFSRDEMKQWEMAKNYPNHTSLRFFIGDVREKERLYRAMSGVDFVVHAAATKIVPTAEYNPFESVRTNVLGAMNVIDACIDQKVKKVIALSTDKASSPVNLYGATKLCSDKLFTASNSYSGEHGTKFSVVRYGNVVGSRGSVVPFFKERAKSGELPITDFRMTRFLITLSEAVETVLYTFKKMQGSEIFVKQIPSVKIVELAKALAPNAKLEEIGLRPGEKLHEQLIGEDEAQYTYKFDGYYKILSPLNNWCNDKKRTSGGEKVGSDFVYKSDTNDSWLTQKKLERWLSKY
jgi:UDP-N-acetylglucosamine 4,6-dehydratase (inverting)